MLDRREFIKFLAGLGFISVGGISHAAYEKGMMFANGGGDSAISSNEDQQSTAVIKVVGVGGGGCNAVNSMIASGVKGAEFIAVDTDKHCLSIRQMLAGAHIVFITAGMGGRTGTGAVPVIARIAREEGALCIAVVTTPFDNDDFAIKQRAEKSIGELSNVVDSWVVLDNQTIQNLTMNERRRTPIDSLHAPARSISRIIVPIVDAVQVPGHFNIEIEELRAILSGVGRTYSGTGEGIGPNRAMTAARNALHELEQFGYLKGSARKVLANIITAPDASIDELIAVLDVVKKCMASEAEIRFSAVVKESLHNRIRVSVLAAPVRRKGRRT